MEDYAKSIKNSKDYKLTNGNYFILSDINSLFLRKHNIDCSVKEFKEKVKKSSPEKVILTGNGAYGFKHTKLYNILNFVR